MEEIRIISNINSHSNSGAVLQLSCREANPQPSCREANPQPSCREADPQPSRREADPQPSCSRTDQQPSGREADPQPSCSRTDQQPSGRKTNPQPSGQVADLRPFSRETAESTRKFHASFPEYAPTPLVSLTELAAFLSTGGIYVKDESFRFGLNAFKALGSSYAAGCYIAQQLGADIRDISYAQITSSETHARMGQLTFVTATDGNHGRGAAWTAAKLGQKCVVYMPEGSAEERLENIRAQGAQASILDMAYDDVVRFASEQAEKNGWILMQDTAWDGYEEIPLHIMQGYLTMALEAHEQLGGTKPTHIFLQAGVGSMAAAVAAFFTNLYPGKKKPVIIIVEPHKAACFLKSAAAGDGRPHAVTEKMDTIMAGLACGKPSKLAWEILRDCADYFISIPDETAAKGMRVLGNPMGSDQRIISGESGASTFGLVFELLNNKKHAGLKQELVLNETSNILCFSTEGDTYKENYRRIVWGGK